MRETTPDLTRISKYISLILRHKPEVIGIQLDAHGWADVNALLAGISKKYFIDRDMFSMKTGRGSGPARATPSRWMWNFLWPSRRRRCTMELPGGFPPPSRPRDCSPKAACMSTFHLMWKQRRRWAAGMGSL